MLTGVLYQTRKKIKTRLNLPLHMIWASRRDHLVGDMTPLESIPSSLVGKSRGTLELSSIPRPVGSVMLHKIEEKKHKNVISQITLRGAQEVWRLLLY